MVEITKDMALLLAGFSLLIVLAVSAVFAFLLGKRKFCYIMKNEAGYYSLALSQFLAWTYIVTSALLTIYLIRVLANVLIFPEGIPYNICVLLGISTLVPIISAGVDRFKYPQTPLKTVEELEDEEHHFGEMLLENGRPTLTRYQMFLWTMISLLIYLLTFFRAITAPTIEIASLSLPDIDPTLVVLMGLSQGAFIGGKLTMKPSSEEEPSSPMTEKGPK